MFLSDKRNRGPHLCPPVNYAMPLEILPMQPLPDRNGCDSPWTEYVFFCLCLLCLLCWFCHKSHADTILVSGYVLCCLCILACSPGIRANQSANNQDQFPGQFANNADADADADAAADVAATVPPVHSQCVQCIFYYYTHATKVELDICSDVHSTTTILICHLHQGLRQAEATQTQTKHQHSLHRPSIRLRRPALQSWYQQPTRADCRITSVYVEFLLC